MSWELLPSSKLPFKIPYSPEKMKNLRCLFKLDVNYLNHLGAIQDLVK